MASFYHQNLELQNYLPIIAQIGKWKLMNLNLPRTPHHFVSKSRIFIYLATNNAKMLIINCKKALCISALFLLNKPATQALDEAKRLKI